MDGEESKGQVAGDVERGGMMKRKVWLTRDEKGAFELWEKKPRYSHRGFWKGYPALIDGCINDICEDVVAFFFGKKYLKWVGGEKCIERVMVETVSDTRDIK